MWIRKMFGHLGDILRYLGKILELGESAAIYCCYLVIKEDQDIEELMNK